MKHGMLCLAIGMSLSWTALAEGNVEEILGYQASEQGIEFQVTSGGCTKKADFTWSVAESWPLILTIYRNRVDACEMLVPYGTKILFTYEELGLSTGAQFVIGNPRAVLSVR